MSASKNKTEIKWTELPSKDKMCVSQHEFYTKIAAIITYITGDL